MVSIVIPYYNASSYIDETVDSIISQSFIDWELIIVDDCSTDYNTSQVLERQQKKDMRIKILKTEKNSGAGIARNIGINEARGRYIAFCDSDDWWYPTKLEEQINFMEKNRYEFTCTWYEDANKDLCTYYLMKQPERQSYRDLVKGCNIGTPGVIVDTRRIGKFYMPEMRRAEDWGTWMILLKKIDYIYTYPKALWKYRHISGSETSNKYKQFISVITMYRTVLKKNIVDTYVLFCFCFLPNYFIKKIKVILNK